jgi:hypothetical protein
MLSGALLLYTAIIVPVQILMWSYDDPCVMFPTLYFDLLVDLFFMVSLRILGLQAVKSQYLRTFCVCFGAVRRFHHG